MTNLAWMSRTAAAVALAVASLSIQAQQAAQPAASAPAEAARPAVANALNAAQALVKDGKYAEALAKVREAEAVGNLTPYESFVVDRTRGAVAFGAGDLPLAAKSLQAAIDSGRVSGDELRRLLSALADLSYQIKDYPKSIAAAQRYFKEGGTDEQVRTLLTNALYLSGDYAAAAKELAATVQADEAAGRASSEQLLRMLASAQGKTGDDAGYARTLERLVARYPKPELWNDLILRVQSQPGFSDHLRLDVYRLRLATGTMKKAGEFEEMAQIALTAGYPAEASKVIDEAYARGLFGKGADAQRQQQLRDKAKKAAAADAPALAQGGAGTKDANAMVNLGYAMATAGQADKGAALIEQGLAKGGVKRPDDARLHLGVAQWMAGQKDAAVKTFQSVQGKDGTADLARLWATFAQAPVMAASAQ
jgi:tetratricopeptide (TPR) repeat protein